MNATSNLDTAALIQRVSEHSDLVAPIVASIVRSRPRAKCDWKDLMGAGFLALVEAFYDYNPARSSFRTYASRRIGWAVKAAILENQNPRELLYADVLEIHDLVNNRPDPRPRPDRAYELREALDSLTTRQREVLQMRLSGYTQDMIARELGISQVAVRGLEQRALKHLRQREKHPLDKAA